jgi:hypothetical protein
MACASAAAAAAAAVVIHRHNHQTHPGSVSKIKHSRWSLGEITDRAQCYRRRLFPLSRRAHGPQWVQNEPFEKRIVGKCNEEIANHFLTRGFCIGRVPLLCSPLR